MGVPFSLICLCSTVVFLHGLHSLPLNMGNRSSRKGNAFFPPLLVVLSELIFLVPKRHLLFLFPVSAVHLPSVAFGLSFLGRQSKVFFFHAVPTRPLLLPPLCAIALSLPRPSRRYVFAPFPFSFSRTTTEAALQVEEKSTGFSLLPFFVRRGSFPYSSF